MDTTTREVECRVDYLTPRGQVWGVYAPTLRAAQELVACMTVPCTIYEAATGRTITRARGGVPD